MKILLAIDDSEFADDVVEFVAMHNWPGGTQFRIMHVLEPLHDGNLKLVLPTEVYEDVVRDRKAQAACLVRKVAIKLRDKFHSPHVDEQILEGHPKEQILKVAHEWQPDAIVLGSHGRRTLNRVLLGSVSLAVVSDAPCAVVVIRPSRLVVEKCNEKSAERKLDNAERDLLPVT